MNQKSKDYDKGTDIRALNIFWPVFTLRVFRDALRAFPASYFVVLL